MEMGYELIRSALDRRYDMGKLEHGEHEKRKMTTQKSAAIYDEMRNPMRKQQKCDGELRARSSENNVCIKMY